SGGIKRGRLRGRSRISRSRRARARRSRRARARRRSRRARARARRSRREDIFNLIIGQEIGNQKDEVKGGGDNDLYNYSSSNEDELFKSVKKKYKGKRKR